MKSFSFAAVLALSLALVGCGWNPFHKMYSATAEIQIRLRDNGPMMMPASDGPSQIAIQIEIMLSDYSLNPIIKDLKLYRNQGKRFSLFHNIVSSPDNVLTSQEELNHLRQALKIEAVRGTNIVKVTAYSEVPNEAADLANAVIERYKYLRDQDQVERSERGIDSLKEQIAQQQKVVEDAKAALVKSPLDADARGDLDEQQRILDSMNIRLKQVIDDEKIMESPVRIISRAVPPPE